MLQKIYNLSPIFFQNLMTSVKGYQIFKQRYNKYYQKEFQKLVETNDKFQLQEERLKEFYNYIVNNSNYFAEFKKIIADDLKIEDLQKLPIMEKEDLRIYIKEMVTRKENVIEMGTGGSTGKSTKFFTHPIDISKKIAYLDYFKAKHGVFLGMKRVSIGSQPIVPSKQKKKIFWRYNYLLNQLYFSAFHADAENLKYYIKKLNDFKPQTIDGYPTVIHRLAKYIINYNIELSFTPIAIFPTAEALTSEMKKDIEEAFGCPVRNQYASSEGAPFITENRSGELEINPETGVFELKHLEKNIYELVVTGFYTTTTPLLRYKIGDSVELFNQLPKNYSQEDIKIKRIIGRNNDFLISNERGIITNVGLSTMLRSVDSMIKESQFVQNKIDEIIIKLVVDNDVNKSKLEKILTNNLNVRFGTSTKYIFKYVDEIEKTSGGKTRFTINNLKD